MTPLVSIRPVLLYAIVVAPFVHLDKVTLVALVLMPLHLIPILVLTPPFASPHRFSVISVNITEGFLAEKNPSQTAQGSIWTTVTNYRTSGFAGAFALGSGFNAATGIYTAQESGIFHVAANTRLDNGGGGYMAVHVGLNDNIDNGLSWYVQPFWDNSNSAKSLVIYIYRSVYDVLYFYDPCVDEIGMQTTSSIIADL